MPAFALFLLAILGQEPVLLKVDQAIPGRIENGADVVRTPTLDVDYNDSPTVGKSFVLRVPETGSYSIELRSFAFDAYLILRDASGKLLTEDDDGLIGTNARINGKFRAEKEYVVEACALHGLRGEFEIELRAGKPPKLNAQQQGALAIEYWQGRGDYLELNQQRMTDEYATAMDGLGGALMELGDFVQAEPYFQASLQTRLEVLGIEDAWTGVSANNLALCLKRQGKYQRAVGLYLKALESWTAEFGSEDPMLARVHDNLGALYIHTGEVNKSRHHLELALQMFESEFGKKSPELVTNLSNLGMLYKEVGDFGLAQDTLQRALTIQQRWLDNDDPKLAVVMGNLGLVMQERGNFAEALPLHQEGLRIATAVHGELSPITVSHINNLGLLYERCGDYPRALELFQRSVNALSHSSAENSFEASTAYYNLAMQLEALGRFGESRVAIEEAMRRMKMRGNPKPSFYAKCLSFLAQAEARQGDLIGAIERVSEAVEVLEHAFGPHSYQVAFELGVLAQYRQKNGEFDLASDLMKRAAAIHVDVFGEVHQLTANDWLIRADIYREKGDLDQALIAAQEALRLRQIVYGERHSATAFGHSILGKIYQAQGDLTAAEGSFRMAMGIVVEAHGKFSSNAARSAIRLGKVLAEKGEHQQAQLLLEAGLMGYMRALDGELPSMTETERMHMVQLSADPEPLLALLCQVDQPDLTTAYALFQQRKGKLTRLQAASLKLAQANQSKDARRLRGELQQVTTELASLVMVPVGEQQSDHAERINRLRASRLKLEGQFNQMLALNEELQTPSWQQVQTAMPPDSALIDFYVGEEVFAWVLRPNAELQLISLGSADVMREQIHAFLRRAKNRGGAALLPKAKDPGEWLSKNLWQPLKTAVGDTQELFICPDGYLCELPFGVLPANEKRYLLEHYRFSYLADPTRLAAPLKPEQSAQGRLFMVGGVNYFRREEVQTDETTTSNPTGPVQASSRARVGSNWSSLPATRDELQSLQDLHQYILEWESPMTVVEGKAATEERVRAEIVGSKFVHLATHGFFEPDHLPSLMADAAASESASQLDQQLRAVGMLPGLLSGLVFAGVNGDVDPSRDDGYLSAEEIQQLDLDACELVVLSACETALGSARSGEGLMSLRRAFSVAGADTVVSSLWKVDDQATASLMKDFYTNLWQEEMPRGEALHQAKLQMLRRNRAENGGDALPSTWGAFVLSGDWR